MSRLNRKSEQNVRAQKKKKMIRKQRNDAIYISIKLKWLIECATVEKRRSDFIFVSLGPLLIGPRMTRAQDEVTK